ncbi:MAG: hypothetical protein ACK5K7_00255 [Bacilli bacterium]
MLKDQKVCIEVKKRESQKARSVALIMAFVYIPLLLISFHYIYQNFIKTESLSKFRFTTLAFVVAIIISFVLIILLTYINKKFYIRDKRELKQAFTFSFLVYSSFQLIYLALFDLKIEGYEFYILSFILIQGITFFLFLFDYNLHALGVYTDALEDFVFYSTERKFMFKNDIRKHNLQESKDPLDDLKSIVEEQTKILAYKDDLDNIGKYFTYFIQKYDHEDKVYVLIYFSNTGKRNDQTLSMNHAYSKSIYDSKLKELNSTINKYLENNEI